MEKADEFSDKPYREDTSNHSVNDAAAVVKDRNCENIEHITSESSNLESLSSSYNTSSENAESKVNLRISDVPGKSDAMEVSTKLSSGGDIRVEHDSLMPNCLASKTSYLNKLNDPRRLECCDEPNMLTISDHQNTVTSASTDSLLTPSCEKVVPLQTASESMDFKFNAEGSRYHSRDGGSLPEEPSRSPEQCVDGEKVRNIPATLDAEEMLLKGRHTDDSDESEIMEHDVKVCDICGDAGREDLLAMCCRCIDGAEHTYCMREMIDEVPEGDWLCEECKLDEENKNANQQKNGTEAGDEKYRSSGQTDTKPASTFIKPDRKGSAVEEPRTSKGHSITKVTGKRRAEESEFSPTIKKQVLEFPRTSSPTRLHALTDSSTKDVDCGKVKSGHQFPSGSAFGNDSPEAARPPATGPRSPPARGAFSKSNSFNFPNARPKTKLVDEIVLQRQKSTKEPASRDTIGVKEMGKSMSFRSTNPGHFNASDSKVKMLSPKSSHILDLRSLKNKKERNFERSNSVKSPLVGNVTTSSSTAFTPKVDKLLASRGENAPFSSACNSEIKPLKGDNKMIAGLKSTSRATNIGAEVPISLGAVNKQLPSSLPGVGTASSNENFTSVEQKAAALKDDNLSKVVISKESTNLADGIKESTTTSYIGTGLLPGSSGVSFQKHKQTGNSAQIDTTDSLGSCGLHTSAMRSSNEVKNKDNKLKAAIEAAMLKKPGIYRKNKVIDQSNGSSAPRINNEVTILDHLPNSSNTGNLASEMSSWQGKSSRKFSADNAKQSNGNNFKMLPAEGITSRIDDSCLLVPSEGKHPMTEPINDNAVALSSLSKISAIPDHEYIWQGSFEISRSGKTAEFWDGLQAHLSTCASPRVFEAVNKLPHKLLLNGVSRNSAWPIQFENSGAKEDNIALYFFAKDVESYEKSYQVLLEDMIRGDLALIGSIDGVELLIFPSNQLPEKSHRWNMFFFLWGVFRAKKNSLDQVSGSPKRFCAPEVASSISADKMSLSKDVCSQGSTDKDKPECKKSEPSLQADVVNVVPGEIVSLRDASESKYVVKYSRNVKVEEVPAEECKHVRASQINMWGEGKGERRFFPVEESFIPLIGGLESLSDRERAPNLELALGAEDNTKRTMITKKEEEEEEEDLSLSLSFSRHSPSMLLFRDK